jgi:4-amino-4-deoxy-L-arabinose transferase-like glycosyltransferase
VRRFTPDTRVLIAAYALLLLIAVLLLPLRIDEMLQLLISQQPSFRRFLAWLPQQPGSAPLGYLVQFPFVFALGISQLGARLPSLLFGLGSCYLFLRIAKLIPLRRPYLALAVFALLPSQYHFASDGEPFEQALFLLLLATLCFLRLLRTPTVKLSVWYGLALTLSIYTERLSYLPAIGYLLFLFVFVNTSQARRSIWFALPATFVPALLFVPYYLWARPHSNPNWLFAPLAPGSPSLVYLQILHDLAGGELIGYALSSLLIIGLFAGVWKLFPVPPSALTRSVAVFCLFGGAITALAVVILLDVWNKYPFTSSQALWATPGIVVSSFAALEWLALPRKRRPLALAIPLALVALCLIGNAEYLTTQTQDLRSEADVIPSLLTGDSCVVFVSEGLSKYLFLMLKPGLEAHICENFFHQRAVLASHAYVRPDQQENAESFFRGLNFTEVKRLRIGGGQIVIVENTGR